MCVKMATVICRNIRVDGTRYFVLVVLSSVVNSEREKENGINFLIIKKDLNL